MRNFYTLLLMVIGFAMNAQPTTSAPTPPARNAADVISVFSAAYTDIAGVNYNPGWGQAGSCSITTVTGGTDEILFYDNCNYQGTDWAATAQNASGMEYLHLDIWIGDATGVVLKITPVDQGGSPSEFLVDVPLTSGAWNSVDLAKGDFTGMAWNNVIQMKFDAQAGTNPIDFYVDNMYFWKAGADAMTDATLSDLQVDGSSVPGFSASAFSYSYGVAGGTTAVPQITSAVTTQSGATAQISQAAAVPGDATVTVTAEDGTTMETYSVSFYYNSPASPAPTPEDEAANVISLFSDEYTDVAVDTWLTTWSQGALTDEMIGSDNVKKYTTVGFVGIEATNPSVDASSMTYLNFDIWTPNMTSVAVKLVSFLGDGHSGANGDSEASVNVPLTQGQWNTIQIPLADFTAATPPLSSLDDLSQFIFTSTPFGSGTMFLDNVYFTTQTLGVEDIQPSPSKISFYPNPAMSGTQITFSDNVKSVDFYDLNGKKVQSAQGNAVNVTVSAGIYLLQVTDNEGNMHNEKLIVK